MGRELINDFNEKLKYSMGSQQELDKYLIKKYIHGCTDVIKTDIDDDKSGVDYIAIDRGGATVRIDAKTRTPGSSKYWRHGEPELALERYSVVESKTIGWLFKESSNHPDYILFTFDKSDSNRFYVIPYQQLKVACMKYWKVWEKKYGIKTQANNEYHSDALFVPASVVINAVAECMSITT